MTTSKYGTSGSRWNNFRKLVFATYGNVCHICGHGGARTVDHLEAVTEHPELALSLANCRPAHGTHNTCKVCGQNCNQLRGYGSVERAKRKLAERAPKTAPKPKPSQQAGRDW